MHDISETYYRYIILLNLYQTFVLGIRNDVSKISFMTSVVYIIVY